MVEGQGLHKVDKALLDLERAGLAPMLVSLARGKVGAMGEGRGIQRVHQSLLHLEGMGLTPILVSLVRRIRCAGWKDSR